MTPIEIQPLYERVESWENGKKQAWIQKYYPGFVDHYDSGLVKRIKEARKKLNQNK